MIPINIIKIFARIGNRTILSPVIKTDRNNIEETIKKYKLNDFYNIVILIFYTE